MCICVCLYVGTCVCTHTHLYGPCSSDLTASGGLSLPRWHLGTGRTDTTANSSVLTLFTKMVPQEDELGCLLPGASSLHSALALEVRTGPLSGFSSLAMTGVSGASPAPNLSTFIPHASPLPPITLPPWLSVEAFLAPPLCSH